MKLFPTNKKQGTQKGFVPGAPQGPALFQCLPFCTTGEEYDQIFRNINKEGSKLNVHNNLALVYCAFPGNLP